MNGTGCYIRRMAETWTAIGIFGAGLLGTIFWAATRFDALSDRMDSLSARIDTRFDRVDARFDSLEARIDTRFDAHILHHH